MSLCAFYFCLSVSFGNAILWLWLIKILFQIMIKVPLQVSPPGMSEDGKKTAGRRGLYRSRHPARSAQLNIVIATPQRFREKPPWLVSAYYCVCISGDMLLFTKWRPRNAGVSVMSTKFWKGFVPGLTREYLLGHEEVFTGVSSLDCLGPTARGPWQWFCLLAECESGRWLVKIQLLSTDVGNLMIKYTFKLS